MQIDIEVEELREEVRRNKRVLALITRHPIFGKALTGGPLAIPKGGMLLEGRRLQGGAPSNNDILTWTGSTYEPQAASVHGDHPPADADYLVGTADGDLSNEIVVGATPGGELGGTWASPTVDATHSGSAHHAQNHKTRHHSGGGDAVQLDNLASPDDNTDLNASTTKHGLLLKLGGGTTNFLRADGIWAAPAGGANHDILDGSVHQDSVADAVTKGSIIIGNATPKWDELVVGADGEVLTAQADGTVAWEAAGGGGGGYATIKDAGSAETQRTTFDLIGGAVFAQDDGAETEIYIMTQPDGTNLVTTSNSSPTLTFLDTVRFSGHIGLMTSPVAGRAFKINEAITTGTSHTILEASGAITPSADTKGFNFISGSGTVFAVDTHTGHIIRGLNFQALLSGINLSTNETGIVAELTGAFVNPTAIALHFAGSGMQTTVTKMYGYKAQLTATLLELGGTGDVEVTEGWGILIHAPSGTTGKIVDYIAIGAEDTSSPSGNIYLIEVGPTTPYLRVVGNFTAAANETPIYISEGATPTLRQLKTKDGAAIGGGDLVCVLV